MDKKKAYKVGKVAIVGRPNVGKSTLLNALVQHKVAIVSPKPQSTRSQIVAYHEDERGQIFFLDTPGFYSARAGTTQYNALIADSIREADVIVYVVDHTRDWGQEEERIWNLVSASKKPVLLAINKIDVESPSFIDNYKDLLSSQVKQVLEISAFREQHLKPVVDKIFTLLPSGERDTTVDYFPTPLLSQSGKEYLAEIIREKVFQHTGQEVPYQTAVRVSDVEEDEEQNLLRISGEILVSGDRYKGMLIGKKGQKIDEIRKAARKELEVATGKKIYVNLKVVVR
jgi:GTP-binding protein Era